MTSLRQPAVSGRREWRVAGRSYYRAGVQLITVGTQWFRCRRHEIPAKLKHGQSLRCVGHSVAGTLKGKEPSSQPWAQCILAKPHLDKAERCRLLMVGTKAVSHNAPVYLHRVGQIASSILEGRTHYSQKSPAAHKDVEVAIRLRVR